MPGPSPRARGAHRVAALDPVEKGTIPACAGSTSQGSDGLVRRRDHPRVRGEHMMDMDQLLSARGPSPRARGALILATATVGVAGTIPACAGSTTRRDLSSSASRDHPRVRGEHMCLISRSDT